jgi:copper chaperone
MSQVQSAQTFTVEGMSCDHCVAAVKAEVGRLAGVGGVDVDLDRGLVVVQGEGVSADAVRAAVESAGYTLATGA